jgi:hypothetical protein
LSGASDDECVENSLLRKIQEIELLEQRGFADEEGINKNSNGSI